MLTFARRTNSGPRRRRHGGLLRPPLHPNEVLRVQPRTVPGDQHVRGGVERPVGQRRRLRAQVHDEVPQRSPPAMQGRNHRGGGGRQVQRPLPRQLHPVHRRLHCRLSLQPCQDQHRVHPDLRKEKPRINPMV